MIGHFLTSQIVLALIAFHTAVAFGSSPDADTALEQARQQEEKQEVLIRNLIAIAANEQEVPSKRQSALESLGAMNSRSAIVGLWDHLLVEAGIICEFHSLAKYPAGASLKKIGSASYPVMWESLNRDRSDRYLFVLAHVIFKIDGKALAVARLKEKLDSGDPTEQQRANVVKILRLFETVDFKDPRNWP